MTSAIAVPTISPSMKRSILMFLCACAVGAAEPVELRFEKLQSIEGSAKWDWWQVRTAFVPGAKPMWITTMSETGKGSSHDFHDIYQSVSYTGGSSWSKPSAIAALKRTKQPDGYEVAPGDFGYDVVDGSALEGGDAAENARILTDVLKGIAGAPRDVVVMNAAAAIVAGGLADRLQDGAARAEAAIESGKALAALENLKRVSNS